LLCGEQGNAPIHYTVDSNEKAVTDGELAALKALIAAKCDLGITNVSEYILSLCFVAFGVICAFDLYPRVAL
jgi:hypothetical protein